MSSLSVGIVGVGMESTGNSLVGSDFARRNLTGEVVDFVFKFSRHDLILEY